MLITHVRPNELWGKKVYDTDGQYLGAVVAIGSRRGVVRKVVVQHKTGHAPVRLLPSAELDSTDSKSWCRFPNLPLRRGSALSGDEMIQLGDSTISARAGRAEALAAVIEADSRVRRWRRVEFAEDGGAVVVVELHHDSSGITSEVIARELEFTAKSALPKLPWVRVQVG